MIPLGKSAVSTKKMSKKAKIESNRLLSSFGRLAQGLIQLGNLHTLLVFRSKGQIFTKGINLYSFINNKRFFLADLLHAGLTLGFTPSLATRKETDCYAG